MSFVFLRVFLVFFYWFDCFIVLLNDGEKVKLHKSPKNIGFGCSLCLLWADSVLRLQDNYREIVFNLSNYLIANARQTPPFFQRNATSSLKQFGILSMMLPLRHFWCRCHCSNCSCSISCRCRCHCCCLSIFNK